MGKRSGFPHRDDELEKLSFAGLQSELARLRNGLKFAPSAKMAKLWQKQIHWIEAEIARRD